MGRLAKILLFVAVIALIIFGIWYFNNNNSKTVGDHVGEAIDAVPAVTNEALKETGEVLEETGEAAGSAVSKAGKSTSSAVSKATDGDSRT